MRLHLTSTDSPRRAAGQAAGRVGRALEASGRGLRRAGGAALRPVGRVLEVPGHGLRRAAGATLRLAGRHPGIVTAVGAAAMCGLLAWLLGSGLEQWFVAQGMDDERAYLLSAMVLVLLATAIVGAASRRAGPTRLGGLVGFVGIQIVPFLIRAAHQPPTPGLRYTQDIMGWILQPLGMLLLAVLCVIVGAALGVGLARDASHLPALRKRRWLWVAIPVAIALIVAASGAAITALQDGPLTALRDYSVGSRLVTAVAPPTHTGGAAVAPAGPVIPTPDIALLRQLPGEIQYLAIGGHPVDVYVPGVYQADPALQLPVLYLLHGTPGDQTEWIQGAQLDGVLDQLIGNGTIPPLLAVMPNGNVPGTSDDEWGNSAYGQVETWMMNQVIPTIDSDYRTLGAEFRGIAGLSSGGFGAVNIAIHNPTQFSWAASYSGYFVGLSGVFGSMWKANSPFYTAATVPASEQFPLYLGAGLTDTLYRPDTVQFASKLTAIGWTDYQLQSVAGGHGWVAWEPEFVNSLTWLGELWGPDPWIAVTSAGSPTLARIG